MGIGNYFNLDFFAQTKDGVISSANLADSGVILSNSKDIPSWINTANKSLTTLYIKNNGEMDIVKVIDLNTVTDLKTAISGINVYSTLADIKQEGYFGSELTDTWHSFLGIRKGKLIYVGAKCGFEGMPKLCRSLGLEKMYQG